MGYPLANRKNQFYSPPRAYGPTGPVGQEVAFNVSATAGYINFQLLTFNQPYDARYAQNSQAAPGFDGQSQGVVDNYITIFADGTDIGIIFGSTAAAVSGGAAPNLTKVGSFGASGFYQSATGTCHRIPAGQERRYLLQRGQDLFMGYIGAATPGVTGTVRIFQSNPPNTGV